MDQFQSLIEDFIRKKQEDKGIAFCVGAWLDSASKRASQISVATHVLKFLHSDARGTNINSKLTEVDEDLRCPYISTASLDKVKEDVVGNAAVMDVASFLQLEINGTTLLDLISKDEFQLFSKYLENETQLHSWFNGFKKVLIDNQLSSDTLAKQVYFYLGDGKYHLLAPLYASSLSQALYEKVKEDRYGTTAKESRDCKRKGLFSNGLVVDYPDLGCQMFGGTKPLNISRLNSLRGGKSYLLRSAPPVWKTIKKPPLTKNAFWQAYDKRVYAVLKDFRAFILNVQSLDSNKHIRDQRQEYVDKLLDFLVQAAIEIQSMESCWSINSKIPIYEQIWLDPFREDYINLRELEDWIEEVSSYFAKWTLNKLKSKNINFADADYDYLKNECLKILKEVS